MKYTLRIVACFALMFGFGLSANAATISAGEHYTLANDQHITGNVYAAGKDVSILGSVLGDTVLGGNKILVNGAVVGDVLAGGSTIDILSPISGDARVAGGTITIGNTINGDVVIVGGTVHLLAGSVVRGDVLIAGGNIALDGAVDGNVKVAGGSISLEGPVKGNVDVKAGQSLKFGTTGTIGGYFHYRAPEELTIRDGAVRGEVKYDAPAAPKKGAPAILAVILGAFFLMMLGGLGLSSIIAVLAFPACTHIIMERGVTRFGSTFLIGFAVLVATPVLAVVAMVTLVGLLPGSILLLAYIALLIVAKIYAGILVGAFLSNWWKKEIRTNWKWALLGTFVLALISVVPVLGGLASFLFFTASLGALSVKGYLWWKTRNSHHESSI